MKLYLAGPMRGHRHFNFPAFLQAEERLMALGHEVFNPARRDMEEGFDPIGLDLMGSDQELVAFDFDLREAMAHDLAWIAREAEGIAMLRYWKLSSGASAELAVANALGLKVLTQPGDF